MDIEQNAQIISVSQPRTPLVEEPVGEVEQGGEAPAKGGLKIGPFIRPLIRKSWLILTIVTISAVVGNKLGKPPAPMYQGTFRMIIEPVTPEARLANPAALTMEGGGIPGRDTFSPDYPTQLLILQSPQIFDPIVKKVQAKYPPFNIGLLWQGFEIEQLPQSDVFLPRTKVIEVRYKAEDPKLVELVLNEVKNKYLRYSLAERKGRITEGLKFLDIQLPAIEKKVNSLRAKLQALQQSNQIIDTQDQAKNLSARMAQITTQVTETQRILEEQKTLYKNYQQQLDLSPTEGIAASALSEQPQYRALLTQIQEIESLIAVESSRFQFQHPKVQSLVRKKQNLLALLDQETEKILGQNQVQATTNSKVLIFQNSIRLGLIKQMVDTANQITALEVRLTELEKDKEDVGQQLRKFPAMARQYTDLQDQLEMSSKTLAQFLNQQKILEIQGAQNQIPWEIVAPPEVPFDPVKGKFVPVSSKAAKSKKTTLLLAGGLVTSLILAFGIEKKRNIFYTKSDVQDGFDLPILGLVPSYPPFQKVLKKSAVLPLTDDYSKDKKAAIFLESIDDIIANLKFRFSDRHLGAIAICSTQKRDGKSTIALHLAQAAASIGQRVLLVDADLHDPHIHKLLSLTNERGLSDILCKKVNPNELITRSELIDNLFVLTAGQVDPLASRLLASAQMQYLMQGFQATFDLVIYDTPPLEDTKDAHFLAANTDGFLMVVAVGKTNCSAVKKAMGLVNSFNIPGLGVIANQYNQPLIALAL